MTTLQSSLQEAFNSFLLTMPVERLEELLRYLNETKAGRDSQNIGKGTAARHPYADANYNPGVPTPAAPRSPALRGKRFREGKLRPLNSFIAFRSE